MAKPIKKKPFKPVIKRPNPLIGKEDSEINYKNIELLKEFIQDHGKIRSREITSVTVQQQRKVVNAIKNARELALLPFVVTITSRHGQRKGRRNER